MSITVEGLHGMRAYRLELQDDAGNMLAVKWVAAWTRSNAITQRPSDWPRKRTRAYLSD